MATTTTPTPDAMGPIIPRCDHDGAAMTQPGEDTSWCVESVNGNPSLDTFRSIRAYMCWATRCRTPARQTAFVPRQQRPSVLVVGNPTGDLPAAQREAEAVAAALEQRRGAEVDLLTGQVTYSDLSTKLNERCWDVVHYAGHARFDVLREDAGGLELAGG